MDTTTLIRWQKAIKQVLSRYAHIPHREAIQARLLFDDQQLTYVLIEMGWWQKRYLHNCLLHVEILNEQVWIQFDGTETGIWAELIAAGIEAQAIRLGFRPSHDNIVQSMVAA